MRRHLPLFLASTLLLTPWIQAASTGDLRQEYDQVHKIALRDPRVREAYARANERLDARIVELDPALGAYVRSHPSHPPQLEPPASHASGSEAAAGSASQVKTPFKAPHHEATPAPAAPVARRVASSGQTHVVAAGETLTSIANQYGVSVASLQALNHITDARKLQAGQTLAIPAAGRKRVPAPEPRQSARTAPASTSHASTNPNPNPNPNPSPNSGSDDSFWDKLKKGM